MKKTALSLMLVPFIFLSGCPIPHSISAAQQEEKLPSAAERKAFTHDTEEMKKIKANPEGFSTSNGRIYTDEEVRLKKKKMLEKRLLNSKQVERKGDVSQQDYHRTVSSVFHAIFRFIFGFTFEKNGVFGADDRKEITDTTQFPYRSIVLLKFGLSNKKYSTCTGAIIDDSTILTAAHCLYETKVDSFVTDLTVLAGYNNGDVPYGALPATSAAVSNAYIALDKRRGFTDAMKKVDYGIVKVPEGIFEDVFENHGFFKLGNSIGKGEQLKIAGYPYDKAEVNGDYTMWESQGLVEDYKDEGNHSFFWHKIDICRGNDGSPNFSSPNGKDFYIYGIQSAGNSWDWNYSCRLTRNTITHIKAMKEYLEKE